MSASAAQIDANRANAQRSTGPATPEGKAASSQNATKHGFLANVFPAEQEDYRALLDDLLIDLQPVGSLQRLLVEEIALAYIRLRRIHKAEMDQMEPRDVSCLTWTQETGSVETTERTAGRSPYDLLREKQAHLVLRYEAATERHIQRCLTRLKEMKGDQTWKAVNRAAAQARSPQPAPDLPPAPQQTEPRTPMPLGPPTLTELLASVSEERARDEAALKTAATSPQIGFVSQKRNRRRRRNHPRAPN
jgi:hypothetical protein